jgi:Co/Zn/Cd efflux system component
LGIILVSIILYYFPTWDLIDPIYTAVLSIGIIIGTIPLADECIHELVGGSPESLDMKKLKHDLSNIPGVDDVHDLHVWNLIEGTMAIAVHIVTEVEDRDYILQMVTLVCHDYKIFHTTI